MGAFVFGARFRWSLAAFGLWLTLSPAWSALLPDPYTRIIEVSARNYRLDVAARRFQALGKPDVWLAGMVHHGSFDYFRSQQAFLAGMPVVLVENNNLPVGETPDERASDEERTAWTTEALNFAASLVEGYHEMYASYPESMETVLDALRPDSAWAADLRLCLKDAWANPVTYHRTDTGYELVSTCGGNGFEPLRVTHAPTWRWTHIDEERAKYRDELGLVEQSNGGLTFNHDNFHFCDMLGHEYEARASKMRPADLPVNIEADTARELAEKYPTELHVRRFLALQKAGAPHVQEVIGAQGNDHLVLIERDDVVWAEMQRRIAADQGVCVVFGAAHMYDLENRLVSLEGYTPTETRWFPVFDADLTRSKISDAEIEQIHDDAVAGKYGIY